MEDWIRALKNTSKRPVNQSNRELLNGFHDWFVCSHARPTYCNICREALNGVTSHGLSCEICKFKAHKRCAPKAARNCKWTTLASIGSNQIIEDEDRNICMPHQWLEGNLPVNAKCSYCDKACGSVLRMQDFRCLWCKAFVHSHCKDNFYRKCNFGVCRVSILPPTHINTVASDGFIRASKAPNTSPLVVFVNSKSGDNQGVKFLRKFKQLLNPFQVFDLIQDGPVIGLRMFQKFDCFRVLVCGGDGSVGWVLKEIDSLGLHKQCQIGVLPLGTGNDLARVLGWGSALDDDNQLPKLLESFERATTKMLDRWSMMTYELPINMNTTNTTNNNLTNNQTNANNKSNTSKKQDDSTTSSTMSANNQISNSKLNTTDIVTSTSSFNMNNDNLNELKEYIWYHLNNLLQNENIDILIDSSQILNSKLNELLMRINEYNTYLLNESFIKTTKLTNKATNQSMLNVTSSLIADRSILIKQKLNEFFVLLKNELKTNNESISVIDSTYNSSSFNNLATNSNETSIANQEIADEILYSPSSSPSSCTSPNTDSSSDFFHHNNENKKSDTKQTSSKNLSTQNCKTSSSTLKINGITEPNESNNNVYKNENNSSNNSIKRRIMLNSISKLYKHKRKIMTRANSLKRSIKQLIKLADIKQFDTTPKNTNHEILININECKSTNDLSNFNIRSFKNNANDYDDDDDYDYVYDNENNKLIRKTSTTNDIVMYNQTNNTLSSSPSPNKNHQRPNTLKILSHAQDIEYELKKIKSNRSLYANDFNDNFKQILSLDQNKLNNISKEISKSFKQINSNDIIANHAETISSNSIKCKDDSSNSGTFNDSTSLLGKSSSMLTINRTIGGINDVPPIASEEQSCISTPNTTNLSLSIDSIYKQQKLNTNTNATNRQSLSRPKKLDLFERHTSIDKTHATKTTSNDTNDGAPKIRITSTGDDEDLKSVELNSESDARIDTPRSSTFLGCITSTSSLSITPNSALDLAQVDFPKSKQKYIPAPLTFLLPPSNSSHMIKNSSPNLPISTSSKNLSECKNLRIPLPGSPSAHSSSGSCYSKTTLPSPRISKKYSKEIMSSTMHLQLPTKRGISVLSSSFRRRSLSKSSDKSSSPTSPSSPKVVFKYNPASSPFSFVGQALLFNADALCAPIAAPVVNEPIIDLYAEKAVMNNYFGIGLDAKLALEFHMTREEHPEKCRSRIRNHMLYGILGSKELLQRTCKNLEQKILLECDGTTIPLKNVQGIVVLNIPSYTGGVNFWGQNSKDENIFTVPSYDDKILEVVAVSGCFQMALSRVVSIKSNRIAQCHTVKIQILGPEGVPVQVDGEAWIQQPGFIYLVHKNRAQMLTRNKVFEHTLKTWSEKQKNDPHLNTSLSKDEFNALQCILDDSITLIKRIKTASLRNINIEQDLYGYAIQASSNLEEISVNGKLLEKSLRQQVTDFLNSIRTLHVETGLFINEKANKLNIEPETIEKIQTGLNDLKISMKKLNDCRSIFQFPMENDEFFDDLEYKRKSRFGIVQRYKKSKIKHKDDKELLRTLHGIPIEEWGPDEVGLWLESLNLSEYKAAFLKHDIRGTEVRNLERRDLRELGIVKVGHIKRILNASKEIPKKVAIEKQSV